MKILILSVTIFNFVIYFPYNGSQKIQTQTNQHFAANSPLSNHSASQRSFILSTEENSSTKNSNIYSGSTDKVIRTSGSLKERNQSETHQASLYNFPPSGDDALSNSSTNLTSASFVYVEGTKKNSTQADPPKNKASHFMQNISAIDNAVFSFATNSQITQKRMTFYRKNSISAPVSMTNYQYKSDFTTIPHFQTISKTTQSLEPFFPSTSKSKPSLASHPSVHTQNAKEEFNSSADEGTFAISSANRLFGTGTTTYEGKAGPDNIFFIDTTPLMAEGNIAKNDVTDIPEEENIILFDVPDLEDNIIIIDPAFPERHGKNVSSEPDLPKKDNSFVIDAINLKNDGRSTVNAQTTSIFSAKNSNDFESTYILNTYDEDNTKSIMFAIDNDKAIFNVNSINTTNYFLNARMNNDRNGVVSNSTESNTMIDGVKSKMHVGDLIISKINGFISTKHYINPNHLEPITNTNINYKIMWPSNEDTIIKSRHTVQKEEVIMSNNNNTAETTGSKVDDSIINYHYNTPVNVHLQIDRDNFKSVSTDEIENVIPLVEEIANMDQDDEDVEVLFIQPDTSIAEISRKLYSLNPDAGYTQTARNKITFPLDNPSFNPLFTYKMKPFITDSKSITNNRVDHRIPTIITSNDAKTKMDFERTKTNVFKTDNFQNNIASMASITHPATAGSIYFSEDNIPRMTSVSKVSISSSDLYTDTMHEIINLSTNDNNANSVKGPNPETDFPMNQGYILPSSDDFSKIMSKALNSEAPISLLSKHDSLTDAWRKTSDREAENPHLTNGAIIHNKVLVDPLNIPQKSDFLTADFISPSDDHNAIASGGKQNSNIMNSFELMLNKTITVEGRPTVAIISLPAKITGILIPRKQFLSLIAKEMAKEKPTPYTEVDSVVEEDSVVQMKENILSGHNFKYSESGDNVFERNGIVAIDNINSLSKFSIIPTSEVTINERELITPGEENVKVLYNITNPTNGKIHLKPMATKAIIANSLGEDAGVTQNAETANSTAFAPPNNSIPERTGYSILPNMYYTSGSPLNVTKENPSFAWNTIKNKSPLTTMDNVDLIDHSNDYQIPTSITSNNANSLTNREKIAGTEINIPLSFLIRAGNFFSEDKNNDVVTDLASITASSPIKTNTLTTNEVNTLYNKPKKLEHGFTISREVPNVSRDEGIVSIADSYAFMRSESPFNHPQATNLDENISLADIIIPKTYFHKEATPTALKVAVPTDSQDVKTLVYIPKHDSKNSFEEDIILNYEADNQKEESIMTEEKDMLEEENVRDYVYIIPIASDNVPKGNNLASEHYSTNFDAYDSTRFRGITKGRADELEFENSESSYAAEASKPQVGKFITEVQRKLVIKNSNSGSGHAEFFGGDTVYPMMKENIPKGYIFTPERESTFTTPDFSIPMKDNINPAKVTKDIIRTNLITSSDLVNATKITPNATITSPNAPAFETNENSDITMSNTNGVLPTKLKSLLLPIKKIPKTEVSLSENDDFLPDTAETILEASEPLNEQYTIFDQNWKIINERSAIWPFSNIPSFPLVYPTNISEKSINVATETQTNANEGISDKTDTIALLPNIVLQTIIHKKRRINKTSDYNVNQVAINPSTKKTATPGTKVNAFLNKEMATLEKESSISEASNTVNLTEPESISTEQKTPRNSKETFYPNSTMSTTKSTEVRARESFSHDNDNLKQSVINSFSMSYHIPLKSTLFPTYFIKNSTSELVPGLVIGESNIKMTDDSIIPKDAIILSDNGINSSNNAIFIEDMNNIINGKGYAASVVKDHVTQHEVIPFSSDFSADSDMIFLEGENNPNNVDLTTVGFDDSTIEYASKENIFYAGEEGMHTTAKKSISAQSEIYGGFGSPAPLSIAHVTKNILKENPVQHKSKQKYEVLISRERNPNSDNNGSFLSDYIANLYSKSHKVMATHSFTNENGNFSPTFSDDLTLEIGSPVERDIITPPEHKWIGHLQAPDPESMVAMEKSKILPGEISNLTMSSTPKKNREQFHRKGISITTYDVLTEAKDNMSPKAEYNKNKTFKSASYNSQDIVFPSVASIVNLDSGFPSIYDNSETKNFKYSTSSLPMKTTYTKANIIALFPENSHEESDFMPPHENNDRSVESPFLLTTESIILIPKALTKNFVLTRENPLTDSSKSLSMLSEEITEYFDPINEIDIPENQSIKMQKDFYYHSLDSIVTSRNSATFISNSTIDDDDNSFTLERETTDIPKIKADAHPQGTITKIIPPKQMNTFLSGIKEMTKSSGAEDEIANLNISHIKNAVIFIPTLETTIPYTSEPNTLSKSNSNSKEENYINEIGNFTLRDSHTLKHNSSFDKFNISAGPQTPLSSKSILSEDSTMSLGKSLKPNDNNFASPNEDTETENLFHNAPSESYGLIWKSTSPSDVTFVSLSKYSELDPLVKMKKEVNTKTNNPFEERNSPTQKVIISPGTKSMLSTIFNIRFVHKNFVGKDIITEHEIVPMIKNILDITLESKNITTNENISTALDDKVLEYVTNGYVFEQQEEKYNPVIKKPPTCDPKIAEYHPSYSSADYSEQLSQEVTTGIKTKEILQNMVSREEHPSSRLGAIVSKSSNNFSSKAFRSMTHPLTQKTEYVHKFIHNTTLERDVLGEDNTIIILPEDKRMEDTHVPNPEIMVTIVESRMFTDETIDPIVINSPVKIENQFHRKLTSFPTDNTDFQDQAENTLSFRINNVKDKANTVEMLQSQDSIIPLAEFKFTSDNKFSFLNEKTKGLSNGPSNSSSPMNTVHTVEDTIILYTEDGYEESDSMLPREHNTRFKGSLDLLIHEKPMSIPNASTRAPESSGTLINNFLNNTSTAWSDIFETMIEHTNYVNGGDAAIKNKNDLKSHSLASTKLPLGSTAFSDNPTKNELNSVPSVNTQDIDISKIETDEIYSEPQIIITKAFSPTKISQHEVFEERKIANLSDQENTTAQFYLNYHTNATVLRPSIEELLPSVADLHLLSKNNNHVKKDIRIPEAGIFSPKDANTLKGSSFNIKVNPTRTQILPNLKEISSVNSTLTLPKASRSTDQGPSPEVATKKETATNTPSGTYELQWKSTLHPFELITSMSSSKYSELNPVFKMKKDTTTTNNIITSTERSTLTDKVTTAISMKGMKNTISKRRFEDKTFIEKDASTEEVPFAENLSEEAHDTPFTGENIPNYENIITIMPIDSALEHGTDNYVFALTEEGHGPRVEKNTLTYDSSVFEHPTPYISDAVSEHLSQGASLNINARKEYQHLVPKEKKKNSDNNATVLKSSTVNFNTKTPRSLFYSLTDPNWTFSAEFYQAGLESDTLIGDKTIIILSKDKRMEFPFVPDSELVSTMKESSMFIADPIDPAITISIEYIDQINRKSISSALYNNIASDVEKPTISNRLGANKRKTNLAETSHSQNIMPLAVFNVIPDGALPFINKDTIQTNSRVSNFSSSINKTISTTEDSIVLSTESSYVGGESTFPEDYVKSRGFSPLLSYAIFIPNSLTENTETSGPMRDNSFSNSSITMSEVLERVTEYTNPNNRDNVPEGQNTTGTDIHSYPLVWNIPPVESTLLDTSIVGEVDSFFPPNNPDGYKTNIYKTYSESQKAMIKAYYPKEEFHNSIYKIKKRVNLSDQEDPAAKFKLGLIKNTKVLIPPMEKTFLPVSQSNLLSKSDNMDKEFHVHEAENLLSGDTSTLNDDCFSVKFDAVSFKSQTSPNLKGTFSADSILTLSEAPRPSDQIIVSQDKMTGTGGSIVNTPVGSYAIQQRSAIPPPKFATSIGTPKYSEFVTISIRGKNPTEKNDYNFPSQETIISADHINIFPTTISSKKDTVITLKGNIFEHKDFIERERDTDDDIIQFTEDISLKVDDNSSVRKITPTYIDHIISIPEDSYSVYVSRNYVFESEDEAKNSFIKTNKSSYASNSSGSHTLYTTTAASDSLSKATPSEFKTKGNYQAIIPRQENKSIDITFTKFNANVNNVHRSTTHFQTDESKNFPSRFSDKTFVGKGTINSDDDAIILSESSDIENKITEYSIFSDTKPKVNSKTFSADTSNHVIKNSYNLLRKDMSPTIYEIFTPRERDTTTSNIFDLAKDKTNLVMASDSRFGNFPLVQLSRDDISNIDENTEDAINTALTSFTPIRKESVITHAVSTKDKINIVSSLPSSKSAWSLRVIPKGLPENPTANAPAKDIQALRLLKNLYHPTMLISVASEPISSDLVSFNNSVFSTRQNSISQMIPKTLYLIYTVSQDDFTGSLDNNTDVEPNKSVSADIKDEFFYINTSGDQNAEPKKTITKFYTFFPNEHIEPNFYYTQEITKTSTMKDAPIEFEENHLTDVKMLRNDTIIQMEINPLQDADLNPYFGSKNLTAGDKLVNKDYSSVSEAMYSSFSIPKDSLPARAVLHETISMARDSNLFTEVTTIIPTNKKSSYPEIISLVGEDSHLEFNIANLRAPNSEFQPLESMNIIYEPIVIEKNLPRFQEISTLSQTNKEVEESTSFRAHIPQLQLNRITPKDISEESTNGKAGIRGITDPAMNVIFLGNTEIVTPQDYIDYIDFNFLSNTPNIPITGQTEDKNVNVDMNNFQNVIPPLTSFTVPEDGNYLMIEDTEPETSSVALP